MSWEVPPARLPVCPHCRSRYVVGFQSLRGTSEALSFTKERTSERTMAHQTNSVPHGSRERASDAQKASRSGRRIYSNRNSYSPRRKGTRVGTRVLRQIGRAHV